MREPFGLMRRFTTLACALLVCAALSAGCASTGSESTTPLARPPVATTTAEATRAAPAPKQGVVTPPARTKLGASAPHRATPSTRSALLYPDPALTPGAVLHVTAQQVSVPGYASRVRDVPVSEKREVYAEYHLAYPQAPGAYECDHFIPLCLGGSNSIVNLWPEPSPQFHWKDGLEVYLWHEVRARRMSLATAQHEIRTDWYAYWVKAGKPGSAGDADSAAVQATTAGLGTSSNGTVGWSVSGARYHYLSCRYFAQISPANRRTGTIAQARAAGKTPCKVCRPPG